ncbi:hypothetical protein CJ030_MR0G006186 [Morella rubra]|uniref:Uncharacterized protein n=1 Tax=Morella rubra TaxID=262757 RepID=A0A6A1UM09_9ROSI|nr:hypothetical protein CJ030_MR0G006186 [Morella rubra]
MTRHPQCSQSYWCARSTHVPFETSKWKEVPDEVKSYVMNRVLNVPALLGVQFQRRGVKAPYPDMNKEEWTCVCDLFVSEEFQRRSAINKENRAKLKIVHTSGARSFQRARALLEKMEALQLQHESEGKSYTEVEIFAEVLGMKAGYVRGLGRSVWSVGSSSSASSVDLS